MPTDYVTDPDLLAELNSAPPLPDEDYVTDPALLAELNGPDPVPASPAPAQDYVQDPEILAQLEPENEFYRKAAGAKTLMRTEQLRGDLTKRMQDAKLFGSFTSAAGNDADDAIRRDEEGNLDLPAMVPQGDSAVMNAIKKWFVDVAGQKLGARLDDTGPGVDKDAIRGVFESFKKDNEDLSDEQLFSVWDDLVNRYKPFDSNEMFRVQSDGAIELNPMSVDILDTESAIKAINESGASEVAKEMSIADLPNIQKRVAENKAEAFEAASIALGRKSFSDFAQERDGFGPEKLPETVRAYEKEVVGGEGMFKKAVIVAQNDLFIQGFGKVAQTYLGIEAMANSMLADLTGSEAAAEWAAKQAGRASESSQAMSLISQGSVDAGLVGSVLKEVPSLAVQVLVTRGAGMAASGTRAAGAIATGTAYATAGLQSAGITFAEEYRAALDANMSEEEAGAIARTKAARAGISTAIITAAFGVGKLGGVEAAAAGRTAAGTTLRDLWGMAGEKGLKATLKSPGFREFAKDTMLATLGEASEEGIDQMTEALINADPDTNLADAWDQAIKAGLIGGVIGNVVHLGASAVTRAQAIDLEMQAREAGAGEVADAAREVDDILTPEERDAVEREDGGLQPIGEGETTGQEVEVFATTTEAIDSLRERGLTNADAEIKQTDGGVEVRMKEGTPALGERAAVKTDAGIPASTEEASPQAGQAAPQAAGSSAPMSIFQVTDSKTGDKRIILAGDEADAIRRSGLTDGSAKLVTADPTGGPVDGARGIVRLSEIAASEGVDLTSMTREQYVDYAVKNGVVLDGNAIRMQPALRSQSDVSDAYEAQNMQSRRAVAGAKTDTAYEAMTTRLKALRDVVFDTGVQIKDGFIKALDHADGWVNFQVRGEPGRSRVKSDETHKAYFNFGAKYAQALTEKSMKALLSALHAAGYNGQVKIGESSNQMTRLADQMVLHGESLADSQLGQQVVSDFFAQSGIVVDSNIGTDTKVNGKSQSYSEKLAQRTKDAASAKATTTPQQTTTTTPAPEATKEATPAASQPVEEQGGKKDTTADTDWDGKTVFIPGYDKANAAGGFEVRVSTDPSRRPEGAAKNDTVYEVTDYTGRPAYMTATELQDQEATVLPTPEKKDLPTVQIIPRPKPAEVETPTTEATKEATPEAPDSAQGVEEQGDKKDTTAVTIETPEAAEPATTEDAIDQLLVDANNGDMDADSRLRDLVRPARKEELPMARTALAKLFPELVGDVPAPPIGNEFSRSVWEILHGRDETPRIDFTQFSKRIRSAVESAAPDSAQTVGEQGGKKDTTAVTAETPAAPVTMSPGAPPLVEATSEFAKKGGRYFVRAEGGGTAYEVGSLVDAREKAQALQKASGTPFNGEILNAEGLAEGEIQGGQIRMFPEGPRQPTPAPKESLPADTPASEEGAGESAYEQTGEKLKIGEMSVGDTVRFPQNPGVVYEVRNVSPARLVVVENTGDNKNLPVGQKVSSAKTKFAERVSRATEKPTPESSPPPSPETGAATSPQGATAPAIEDYLAIEDLTEGARYAAEQTKAKAERTGSRQYLVTRVDGYHIVEDAGSDRVLAVAEPTSESSPPPSPETTDLGAGAATAPKGATAPAEEILRLAKSLDELKAPISSLNISSEEGRTLLAHMEANESFWKDTLEDAQGVYTILSEELDSRKDSAPVKEYSIKALQETFDLTEEQAVVADSLIRAMGIDTAKLRLSREDPKGAKLKQGTKGAAEFAKDGTIILRGLQSPDFTTAVHELAHAARRNMDAVLTPEEVKTVEDWAQEGKGWDRKAEERWARGWEKYFTDGIAPLPKLKAIFDKIAKWMQEVYKNVQGSAIDVEISEEVRKIFDKLASRMEQTLPPEMLGKVGSEQDTAQTPPVEPPVSENAPTPEPEPEEETFGVTMSDFAKANNARKRMGLPPISPNKMGTDQQAMDEAFARLTKDPLASIKVLARVEKESQEKDAAGKRLDINPLNTVEIALVLIESSKREMAQAKAHRKWRAAEAAGDPTGTEAAYSEFLTADDAMAKIGVALALSNSAWGRTGRAMQMRLDEDYSLAGMRRKFVDHVTKGKVDENGKPDSSLTPEQERTFAKYAEEMQELEARAHALEEARVAAEDGNEELAKKIVEQQALIEQLQKEVEVAARNGLAKTDNAARRRRLIRAKLDPLAEQARARLREKGFGQGPTLLMQEANVPPATVARHSELEAKHKAGTITPEETAEAERLVEEAARAAGYDVKAFHAGTVSGVTTFRALTHFGSDIRQLEGLKNRRRALKEAPADADYEVFLKIKNPKRVDDTWQWGDRMTEALAEGHDGLVYKNYGEGFNTDEGATFKDSYVPAAPSQIKSADPFTGVPLDQRFNPDSPSILYQDADPTGDLAAIIAARLVEEDLDLADATVEMIREFGEGIAYHVEQAYGMAKQLLADTRTGVEGEGHQSAEAILASLGQDIDLTKQDVWDLARAHVIAGKRGSDVLDAVTDDLQPLYEGLTRDDVATLFTDYGKVSYPDPGEIPQTLNRLRLLERAALKLIDTAKTLAALSRGAAEVVGLMPKRTGFQRGVMDESSPEAKKQLAKIRQDEKRVRKEMREIEDKMREEGIEVPDDGRRLKTQLEATKRRMANEIEEIEQALTPPLTPRVRVTRGGVTFDEDATKLRAELERLREDYREAFKTETTEEQKIQTAIKGLDRRIAEVEQMLKDGTPSRAKAKPVTSPEIEERRETLKELNQKRKELRDALDGKKELSPEELAREAASKVAGRWIDKLSKAQSDTITWSKRAEVNPMSDLIAAHIKSPVADFETQATALGATPEQAQSLKKLAETERSHIELVKQARVAKAVTPEQRAAIAEKSLDRRIAEEESMLKEGILTRPKNEPITSPALEAKRNRLAELRQRRRDLYEAAHPGETALEQAKAATLKAIARMEEMLRTGDVAAKRREQVTPDEHLESLLAVRNALADEVAERRRALPKTPAQERAEVERALRQSEATLAKLEAKLAAGDLSVKTTLPTLAASNPAVQKVRNHIKELNKELARQRRAAKPKKDPMVVRLERYIRDMAKRREMLKERVRTGNTSPLRKKTEPLRQKEARDAKYAYEDAKKEFNEMVFEETLKNMGTRERFLRNTQDIFFQLGRMIMTSFDVGAIGRQGFLVALNNPKNVLSNFTKAFKSFSEEYAKRIENDIQNHEHYHLFTEAGLSITSWRPGFKLEQQEEEHRSRLARNLPVIGPGVQASERSYVTYLNAIRMTYADMLYKSMEGRGVMTDAGLKELMNHVNNMTGRGSLGKFETSAGAISDYLFSVKYWSSRLRFLGNLTWRPLDFVTGGAISKMTMKSERLAAQKIISREYAKSALGYAAFYSLLAIGRTFLTDDEDEPLYDIGSDPQSSDFGKLVFKNGTRVDVGAGVLQNAVFLSRAGKLIFGEGGSGFNNLGHTSGRMLRSKLSPSVGVLWNLATKEDFLGDPVYTEKELVGMYVPLSLVEFYEGMAHLGFAKGTAAGIAAFLGFGTSTYGPGTKDVDAIEDLIVGEYSPIKATSNGILFFFDREVQPNRYMLPPEVGFTRKK